jgi:hypothetical protein
MNSARQAHATPSVTERAQQLLRNEWQLRGEAPAAQGADWLQGTWSEVLSAVELKSRSGEDHLPLSVLLKAAREMAVSQAAVA